MPNAIPSPADTAETDAERQDRLAAERRLLDEAEAEAERDGTIPAGEVHAWVRSLSTVNPLPMPEPRKP